MRQVRLRAPEAADLDARIRAGRASEILRMYGHVGPSEPEIPVAEAQAWLDRLIHHPCAFVIEADGQLAGEARLDGINPDDRRARLAIGLLRPSDLGQGIGRQAVRLLLAHGFGPLGLHRIDLRVLAFNQRAIRCYQACGFRHEGTERQSALVGGEWHDDWIMAILKPEFDALS